MEKTTRSGRLPPVKIRDLPKVSVDAILVATSFALAFLLRFDFSVPSDQVSKLVILIGPVVAANVVCLHLLGAYRTIWRYVSTPDVRGIILANVAATGILAMIVLGAYRTGFPRSVIPLTLILSVASVSGVRLTTRAILGMWGNGSRHRGMKPVLIVGAGTTGESVIREMKHRADVPYYPVGIIDDDRKKQGLSIHGVKVMGTRKALRDLIKKHHVEEVLICAPTISREVIRDVFFQCEGEGIACKTLPGIYEIIDGRVGVEQIRRVQIEDILGREPVPTDLDRVKGYLSGKVVMVTGAGGSIGSEICRQISRLNPARLVMVDQGEGALFEIEQELKRRGFEAGAAILADVGNPFRIRTIIRTFQPSVIFHAAAYKHVPLTEANPAEAIRNNLLATAVLAEAAAEAGVERLVYISTDKAVEPVGMLGISKALGEKTMKRYAQSGSATKYMIVRFGNVLDSSGSVIPIFRNQIARGGPVTVTHPEMFRYFMTIPEAVHLVLEAATMGRGGETFVLDMGEEVSILELARNMIRLSGFEPDKDIPISFTGVRPGERLHEKLFWDHEDVTLTEHHGILIAENSGVDAGSFDADLSLLRGCIYDGDEKALAEHLRRMCERYLGTEACGAGPSHVGAERLS